MKKPTIDVYLAGAMTGRTVREVLDQRAHIKSLCIMYGVTFYDPAKTEGLELLDGNTIIQATPSNMERYVRKDERNLDKCRVLLNFTGDMKSDGTSWEMARMFYHLKRPIIVISQKMIDGEIVNFTSVKATYIAKNIYQALDQIKGALL